MIRQVILLAALLLACPSHADVISGLAKVTDGDTIRIKNERIRLHGIDAPELRQKCGTETGEPYQCGISAFEKLRETIGNQPVDCQFSKGIATTASSAPALTPPARTYSHGWSKAVGR